MIPAINGFLNSDFEITEQSSVNYEMHLITETIYGKVDRQNAMVQVIYKILNTERYQYPIYSWNYGIELIDLYGEETSYVLPELKRRITEALITDDRINSVDGFDFSVNRGEILCTFTVHTVFGEVEVEKVVNL